MNRVFISLRAKHGKRRTFRRSNVMQRALPAPLCGGTHSTPSWPGRWPRRWSAVLFSHWKKLHCSCAAVSKRAQNVNKGHFAPRTLPVRTAAVGEVLQRLSRRGQSVECGNNNNTRPAETQSKVQPTVRVKRVTAELTGNARLLDV